MFLPQPQHAIINEFLSELLIALILYIYTPAANHKSIPFIAHAIQSYFRSHVTFGGKLDCQNELNKGLPRASLLPGLYIYIMGIPLTLSEHDGSFFFWELANLLAVTWL